MATSNKVQIDITANTAQAGSAVADLKDDFAELGTKGAASAKQLESAWSTVGAKSFADTRAEINKVNIALEQIKNASKNPLEIKLATQAAQQHVQALEGNLKGLKVATAGVGGALASIAPGFAAAFTGAELVRTITQADSLKRGLEAITGSTQGAQAELAFIKKTAGELGLELNRAGQAYLSLSAATKGTNLEGQKTKDIFTSVSRAMSALGKSSAETDLALRAVSQIASKGTVSMEELRGQLGEALPGALKAAADGMGVTTQELIKMVESGGVLASDLLPKLATSLDKIYAGKPVTSLTAEFNRFKNSITEVGAELGEAGLTKALGDVAVAGTQAVGFLGKAFVGLGQGIGKVAGAVTTLNFQPLADDLQVYERLFTGLGEAGTDAMGDLAGGVQRTTVAVEDLTPAIAGVKGALDGQKKSADEAGEANKTAFRKLEIAALNAGPELTKTAANAVAAFDKLRTSGDTAAEAVGKIGKDFDLGNSAGIRDASLALNKLAADGKISAAELQAAWANLLKVIDLQKFEADAKKAFSGANQDAKLLEQTLDAGLRQAITRTGLDFEVIKGGMGKAAASAINDTDVMIAGLDRLKAQGVDTGQVLTASIGKGIATADSQKAIEAVRSQIEALRKTLGDKVADGLLDQAAQKARELTDALNKNKPGIQGLREAMQELGLTTREELGSSATKAKEAFDQIIKSGQQEGESYAAWQNRKAEAFEAYAKRAIAANGGVATEALKSEAAMRGFSIEGGKAGDSISRAMKGAQGSVQALGNQVQLTTEQLAAQAKQLDEINSKYGQGIKDREFKTAKVGSGNGSVIDLKDRGTGAVDNTGLTSLQAKKRAGTLSAEDLKTAQAVFDTAVVNKDVFDKNATVFSLEGARSISETYNAARVLLDEVKGLGQSGKTTQGQQQGAVRTTQNNYTVKIDLGGGRTRDVNVASSNDAQALIQSLKDARLAA